MNSFQALGLSRPVVEAVEALGFQQPTDIQELVIPRLLENARDLIALAQTGTGKTAAFGLPLIDLINPSVSQLQALILAPTRELALQISGELQRFAARRPELRIVTVYGGADIRGQIRELQAGVHLIVATPGRLRDLMARGKVYLDRVRFIVLDEADEMLNMGFRPDIDLILSNATGDKHTWLFSATMSGDVQSLAGQYLRSPLEITSGSRNSGNEDIEHQYILVHRNDRYEVLRRLLDFHADFYGLVFCRTRAEAKKLAKQLNADGYTADALHGDLSQSQREWVLDRFRQRQLRLLIATDVAARGLDIDDLTHVIHFNIPEDLAFYTHRSGRTGRAGKQGTSIALLTKSDQTLIKQIEKRSRIKFTRIDPPSGAEIYRNHLKESMQVLRDTPVREEVSRHLSELVQELKDLSREDLIARIASQSIRGLTTRYQDAHPVQVGGEDQKGKGEKSDFRSIRLFINLGRVDGYDKGSFLRLVCEHSGIPGSAIGRIDLQHTFTHFDVEESLAPTVMEQFRNSYADDRKLRVNTVEHKKPAPRKKPQEQGPSPSFKKKKKSIR